MMRPGKLIRKLNEEGNALAIQVTKVYYMNKGAGRKGGRRVVNLSYR